MFQLSSTNPRRLFVTYRRVVGKGFQGQLSISEQLIAGRNLAEQIMSLNAATSRAELCVTLSPDFLPQLLSLNCMECRPHPRSLVVLLVCALAFSCTICPYLDTPGPVVTPLNPGAQIEAMLRPSPPASTATAPSEKTGGASKILVKSKLPALLTSVGKYPSSRSGFLISAASFFCLYSACLQLLSVRSPPRSSYN